MRGQGQSTIRMSWNTTVPRIVLTSDTDEFDETIVQHFHEEGFQLAYLAYEGNHNEYMSRLQHLQDPLELGEKYAIVGRCHFLVQIQAIPISLVPCRSKVPCNCQCSDAYMNVI